MTQSDTNVSSLRAEVQIRWDAMIWATGRMDEMPAAPGQYRIRLARQQGDYHPHELLELILGVSEDPLSGTERQELMQLRARVADLEATK